MPRSRDFASPTSNYQNSNFFGNLNQNLSKFDKKKFQIFYLINVQMSPKFEANLANKIFLGVNLLLFDKIMLKFQIS